MSGCTDEATLGLCLDVLMRLPSVYVSGCTDGATLGLCDWMY